MKINKLMSGDYEYSYNQYWNSYGFKWENNPSQNGWGVRVVDTTKTAYGKILSTIGGKPVTNMYNTFNSCASLITAPTIPNSVTNMYNTFANCTRLMTAPAIPDRVTNMSYTFYSCTSLVNAPAIPNSVANMHGTFQGCYSLKNAPVIPNG